MVTGDMIPTTKLRFGAAQIPVLKVSFHFYLAESFAQMIRWFRFRASLMFNVRTVYFALSVICCIRGYNGYETSAKSEFIFRFLN